jgi:Tfp pilus assembly protein PilN
MIEINLLPGSGKKAKSRGASSGVSLGATLAGLVARVKDPFLLGAAAAISIAVLAVAAMFLYQQRTDATLTEREQQAVQDSTRFAAVLKEKRKAESQRDSVMRQLTIIKSIDNDRYVWPHIMDEVSRALPPYTWLTTMAQTSIPQTASSVDAAAKEGAAAAPVPAMKFRITGNTVDIQALTRFMRMLEQSAFVQNVQLAKSDLAVVEGKEVTVFALDAEYQKPDSSVVRTVPVALSVR